MAVRNKCSNKRGNVRKLVLTNFKNNSKLSLIRVLSGRTYPTEKLSIAA